MLSHVGLFATPWTVALQTRLSMWFSRQEYWSGLPFPSPVHEMKSEREFSQSCPTLRDPMDCSPPGSSIHGIFQARVLEWIAISFSRGFSQPRNWTRVSRIAGRCFTIWATSNPTHRHIPWGNQSWKRHMYSLFIAARYRIARTWKQPRCPLTDEWIKKFWYICTWNITQPWIGTHLSQF